MTDKKWIVVSFHTDDQLYTYHAAELKKSLERFDIPYHIEEYTGKLDPWNHVCAHKPVFLREMREKYPDKALIWIDADARVKQYPLLFDHIPDDCIGFHKMDRKRWYGKNTFPNSECLTGTLYFSPSQRVDDFLELWDRYSMNLYPQSNDQETFLMTMSVKKNVPESIDFVELPASYCQIFDTMAGAGDPVIEHLQASREARRVKASESPGDAV